MSQGLWAQLCLLSLPAGVLNTPLPGQAHLGGGSSRAGLGGGMEQSG